MRRFAFAFALLAVLAFSAVNVASAGTGGNKTGQACYKGMYVNYQDPSTGQPFASQDACVSFVANGGTLVPEVDVSVTFNQPSVHIGGETSSGDVVFHNNGLVQVTVTVRVTLQWTVIGTGPTLVAHDGSCQVSADSNNRPVNFVCSHTLQPGGTYNPVSLGISGGFSISGTASITSVSPNYPDPNTSNNVTSFSLTS